MGLECEYNQVTGWRDDYVSSVWEDGREGRKPTTPHFYQRECARYEHAASNISTKLVKDRNMYVSVNTVVGRMENQRVHIQTS